MSSSDRPPEAQASLAIWQDRLEPLLSRELSARVLGVEELAPGLGHRHFLRVSIDAPPHRLIARLEDPGAASAPGAEPALEPLRSVLERAGLPVPRSYGGDTELGIDLLEDVGDETLEGWAASATPEALEALLARVLADLPKLQSLSQPRELPAFARSLDRDLLLAKGRLFARHALGGSADETVAEGFEAIAEFLESAPRRLAHRDFQSQNILLESGGDGPVPRWIDLQGAFMAPPEYDAVCLLRDSYLSVSEAALARLCDGLRPALPDHPSAADFARRFSLLSLARKGKDVARFLEAARERGDRRYLRYAPRTWDTVRAAARECASLDRRLAGLCEAIEAVDPETVCKA
jgi:aminoglycoside/choline kinase family phosphotransferase